MKIALVVDQILASDLATEHLELLFELFHERPDVYCLAFDIKTIEALNNYRIHAPYISHLMKTLEHYQRWSCLIPNAMAGFKVNACDAVISLSSGWAHGIQVPPRTPHLSLLFNLNIFQKKQKFSDWIFSDYLNKWKLDRLSRADTLWTASHDLKKQVENYHARTVEIFNPAIRLRDYTLPSVGFSEDEVYLVANADSFSSSELQAFIGLFEQNKERLILIGKQTELPHLQTSYVEYKQNPCSGELAPILGRALGYMDLTETCFSSWAMASLACGRPLLYSGQVSHHEYFFKDVGINLTHRAPQYLFSKYRELRDSQHVFVRRRLRENAQKFSDAKFKQRIKRWCEQVVGNQVGPDLSR